jgi:arylsulfatase A-like enzyme
VDILASLAALTGRQLPQGAAQDSRNELDVLLGRSKKDREGLLEESYTLSLRKGKWKYIAPVKKPRPAWMKGKKIATGLKTVAQLYDMQQDPGETHDVADQHPEVVKALKAELEKLTK